MSDSTSHETAAWSEFSYRYGGAVTDSMDAALSPEAASLGIRSRLAARPDLPLLAGIVAVIAWGVGPLFVKGMTLTPPSIVFYRVWLGAAVMYVLAKVTGGGLDLQVMRRTWWAGVPFGVSMVFGFWAFKTTSIANATIIGALTPALVLVLAGRIYGERHSRWQILGAIAGFIGVAVVVLGAGKTSGASLKGDVLALINLVIFAAYLLIAKKVRVGGVHAGSYISAVFTWSAIIITPWALVAADDLGDIDGKNLLLLLGMAMIPGLIGHSLMAWAQADLDVSVVSLLGLANPVIASIGAWVVFGQVLTGWQYLGSILVLGGLFTIVGEQRKAVL